jgi:hypothetical protein
MKKETAVEWLEQNMPNISKHIPLGIALEFTAKFQQAKEMEREQIIDTYIQGCEKGEMFNNENRAFATDAEQYYNETFNNEENSSNTTN